MLKNFFVATALCSTIFFFSCQTNDLGKKDSYSLNLVFAGDVMAHTQNYKIDDFSRIWQDISAEVNATDFAFMNLEAPVVESLPFESYPTFNMKPSYPQAAFDAGFNLISLANNHTDDKDPSGMKATQKWAEGVAEKTANSARPIYFSGLVKNGEFTFEQFEWRGYKILFIAATELLNTWRDYDQLNFIQPNKKGRSDFVERIKKLNEDFINSLKAQGRKKDAVYYNARLDALKKIEGIYTWQ